MIKSMKPALLPAGLYVAILFIVPASHQQDSDDSVCYTPRNEHGTCIGIQECRYLDDLSKRENDPAAKEYVQSSHCKLEGHLQMVCCPRDSLNGRGWWNQTSTKRPPPTITGSPSKSNNLDSDDSVCYTPRNELGTCIGIQECRYLDDLSKRENDPAAKEYVQSSHCKLEGHLQMVCCPTDSLNGRGWWNHTSTKRPPPTITGSPSKSINLGKFPDPIKNECGIVAKTRFLKVVGGTPSKKGQWPWMTGVGYKLRYQQPPENPIWMCGGSLITRRYVLTAAHCVHEEIINANEPYIVLLGAIDQNDTSSGVLMEIEEFTMHEDYIYWKKDHDIALLRLRQEVVLTDFIQPVCLPFDDSLKSLIGTGFRPFVAGWGLLYYGGPKSMVLRHVQVTVQDSLNCSRAYQDLGVTINEDSLCAGLPGGGKDACTGDSGGPLMSLYQRKYYVMGVVSYGMRCAEPGFPGVYMRVTSYLNWISNNIR